MKVISSNPIRELNTRRPVLYAHGTRVERICFVKLSNSTLLQCATLPVLYAHGTRVERTCVVKLSNSTLLQCATLPVLLACIYKNGNYVQSY